jgi:hypothetical protein
VQSVHSKQAEACVLKSGASENSSFPHYLFAVGNRASTRLIRYQTSRNARFIAALSLPRLSSFGNRASIFRQFAATKNPNLNCHTGSTDCHLSFNFGV